MTLLTRREALAAAAGITGVLAIGGAAAAASSKRAAMTVHRSPSCGCCGKWIDIARAAGYPIEVVATEDIMAVKQRLGVPGELASCHTSEVGGYVVEGHVPIKAIDKLLRDKPKGIAGIAVPGMPPGSPGMEAHGDHGHHGDPAAFDVLAFDRQGRSSKFAF